MKQEIKCRHFGTCSGCVRQHQVDQLPAFEALRLFFAQHQLELPPLVTGMPVGWRHRAKLVVAPSSQGGLSIGLYRAQSHEVEAIPDCKVHHPKLQQALAVIQRVLTQEAIAPYDEAKRSGLLRYLLLAFEEESQSVQLTFVAAQRDIAPWQGCVRQLIEEEPNLWHSIWLNPNCRADNVIWGETWDQLFGKPWLHTQVGDALMALHPGSFFQANVPLFRTLIEDLTLWVPIGARVVEFYSGCGVMGLHLAAARGCRLKCVERNPIAKLSFEASMARMSREHPPLQVEFIVESTEKALDLLHDAQVVLVDPPRKGLASELIAALKDCKVGTTCFYMSCGWQTLMRDVEALCVAGWRIKRGKSYLFFPGTDQIECLVEMEKTKNA